MITQDQTIVKQIKLVGFWARYGFFDQPHHHSKKIDDISNLFWMEHCSQRIQFIG